MKVFRDMCDQSQHHPLSPQSYPPPPSLPFPRAEACVLLMWRQEHHAFLDVTFRPSEPFAESGSTVMNPEGEGGQQGPPEEPGKHHPGFRRVPRDKIDIKISGIEAAMAQEVVLRILKFGKDFNRAQEAGLANNTDLTGAK